MPVAYSVIVHNDSNYYIFKVLCYTEIFKILLGKQHLYLHYTNSVLELLKPVIYTGSRTKQTCFISTYLFPVKFLLELCRMRQNQRNCPLQEGKRWLCQTEPSEINSHLKCECSEFKKQLKSFVETSYPLNIETHAILVGGKLGCKNFDN